ncbi:MAG TPA: PLP-dependent transferase [Opitutaceae bacterium]|jgi:hypothetical protein|nr:PLP-dependent transferase [Opitutaceae bacterium]
MHPRSHLVPPEQQHGEEAGLEEKRENALSREEQEATGVTEDYVRLSVGLEDVRDIKADIDQALRLAVG